MTLIHLMALLYVQYMYDISSYLFWIIFWEECLKYIVKKITYFSNFFINYINQTIKKTIILTKFPLSRVQKYSKSCCSVATGLVLCSLRFLFTAAVTWTEGKEKQHKHCGYHNRAFVKSRSNRSTSTTNRKKEKRWNSIVTHCVAGVSLKLRIVFNKHRVPVYLKSSITTTNHLKDKT